MPNGNIENFGQPPAEFQPARVLPTFETQAAADSEDRLRAQLLEKFEEPLNRARCRAKKRLQKRLAKRRKPGSRRSLASSRDMRRLRNRVAGWLAAYIVKHGLKPVMVTLMPNTWMVPAAKLDDVDPRKLMQQIRTNLNREGARDADGGLFAGLDCELDPISECYFFHVHMVAWGGMLDVAERLRATAKYRYDPDALNKGSGAVHPVRFDTVDENLLSCLTYLIKGFWVQRVRTKMLNGDVRRSRTKNRITGRHFVDHLLWLDRQRPADLYLTMKLQVTRNGFLPLKSCTPKQSARGQSAA